MPLSVHIAPSWDVLLASGCVSYPCSIGAGNEMLSCTSPMFVDSGGDTPHTHIPIPFIAFPP